MGPRGTFDTEKGEGEGGGGGYLGCLPHGMRLPHIAGRASRNGKGMPHVIIGAAFRHCAPCCDDGQVTALPAHKVNVLTRRAGGAFGGKLTRMLPLVASASLGAFVTGKQVHVQLEWCQDMIMVSVRAAVSIVSTTDLPFPPPPTHATTTCPFMSVCPSPCLSHTSLSP